MEPDLLNQLDAMIRVAETENQHYLAGQLRTLRESTLRIINQRDELQAQLLRTTRLHGE